MVLFFPLKFTVTLPYGWLFMIVYYFFLIGFHFFLIKKLIIMFCFLSSHLRTHTLLNWKLTTSNFFPFLSVHVRVLLLFRLTFSLSLFSAAYLVLCLLIFLIFTDWDFTFSHISLSHPPSPTSRNKEFLKGHRSELFLLPTITNSWHTHTHMVAPFADRHSPAVSHPFVCSFSHLLYCTGFAWVCNRAHMRELQRRCAIHPSHHWLFSFVQ